MYDLNIKSRSSREKDQQFIIKRLVSLGWNCIAWNKVVIGKPTTYSPQKIVNLEPLDMREANKLRVMAGHKELQGQLRQLSRITVIIDDVMDAQALSIGNDLLNKLNLSIRQQQGRRRQASPSIINAFN